MIGYGTMWFITAFGATPFHFDPKSWSHEAEVEMDSRRIYFCPQSLHQNTRTLVMSDTPHCPVTVDDEDYLKGIKIVDVTIYIPHVVFYSHELRTCYMKDIMMHCYQNMVGMRDTCAPCPVVVYPHSINKTTCKSWDSGTTCYSPPPEHTDPMRELLYAFIGNKPDFSQKEKVGIMTWFGEGARTNNEIYRDYPSWFGVHNYPIRNCYMEKGTVIVKGPHFDTFETQWGDISLRQALSGKARIGMYRYSGYFKKFEQKDMCYYIAQFTLKNVKYREVSVDSVKLSGGQVPNNAKTIIQVTSKKLSAAFSTYDNQLLTDVPSCIKRTDPTNQDKYYHLTSDRIMRVSNLRHPPVHLDSEELIYEAGYSERISATATEEDPSTMHREVTKKKSRFLPSGGGVGEDGKVKPAGNSKPNMVNFFGSFIHSEVVRVKNMIIKDKKRPPDQKFDAGRVDWNTGANSAEHMTFLTFELQRVINYNAAQEDRTQCIAQRNDHERRKLNALLFPSQEASRLVGKRVKVIGPGGEFMRITPCQPVDYEIIENIRLDNAADLDPKYIYRVFPKTGGDPPLTKEDLEETSAKNGSFNILYLHHDLFNESFGAETRYPKTYRDLYRLSGINVKSLKSCYSRPLMLIQDPSNPRIKIVVQLDPQQNVQIRLRDIGRCQDVQTFAIEETLAVFIKGMLVGFIDRRVVHDFKRMTEIRNRAVEEERNEAEAEIKFSGKTRREEDEDEKNSLPPVLLEGEESKEKTTVSIRELREHVGVSHGGSVYSLSDSPTGRSDLMRLLSRMIVVHEPYPHTKAANVPDMFFNLFDDQGYTMLTRLQSVEERSYHELMLDMVRRTDIVELSYAGNAGLKGGIKIPNDTKDDSDWNRAVRSMYGTTFNGGFFEDIGDGVGGFFHTLIHEGGDAIKMVGGLIKGGVEETAGMVTDTAVSILGGLFDGIGGKILIGLGATAGVALFVFILFKCISSEQAKRRERSSEDRLVKQIAQGQEATVAASQTLHEKDQ